MARPTKENDRILNIMTDPKQNDCGAPDEDTTG